MENIYAVTEKWESKLWKYYGCLAVFKSLAEVNEYEFTVTFPDFLLVLFSGSTQKSWYSCKAKFVGFNHCSTSGFSRNLLAVYWGREFRREMRSRGHW